MKKILILGGNGFIGTHLINGLLEATKFQIHVLQRKPAQLKNPRLTFFIGSYTDQVLLEKALTGVDLVVHLVMNTSPRTSNLAPVADLEDNLVPTVRLLDAMVKKGVKKIIYTSSGCSVYGENQDLASEESPLDPISSYGIVKVAIENYLKLYERLHGLEPLIFRVACMYGPGYGKVAVQGLITTALHKMSHQEPLTIWGDGSSTRDYLYIDDLVSLCLQALQNFKTGTYNAGSGQGYSIQEVLETAAEATGQQYTVKYTSKVTGDIERIVLDISRVTQDFNWRPQINLKEGIIRVWKSLS